MTTPKSIRFYLKFKIDYLQDKISFLSTKRGKNHKTGTLCLYSGIFLYLHSVLHKITLIGPAQSSQFMEWHNLGIGTLKHAVCAPNVFQKLPENQITINFIYVISPNFVTILHINYWYQVNSWRNFLKFWNDPFCRNKSGLSALLNVAAYWQGSNTKTCAKKPSQILANNMDNGGEGDWCENLCEVL